ncbi:MAG: sugar kinase [Spirochaetaceae bacterium]|jgi:2-dehydro-3-deoxygluconokinase|nr:sugar kinase [Spirochaetaceae bacterium]
MFEVILFGEPMVMFAAESPGPLEDVECFTRHLAGAEVNVAIGLLRLKHSATYITRLGNDTLGRYIRNKLNKEGIDTRIIQDDRHFTGFQLKEKVLTGDPIVDYYRRNSAASHLCPGDIEDIDFSGARLLHITGIPAALSEEMREVTFHIIQKARECGLPICFDPNLRPGLWKNEDVMIQVLNKIACRCDFILPGYKEGLKLVGSDDPGKIAAYYLSQGAKMVTVKLGGRGSYTQSRDERFYQDAKPIDKIVDTVGAGDGFAVGVISGILEGLSLYKTVERANAIGALQLRHGGDNEGLPTRDMLETYLEEVKNGAFAGGY